MLSHCLLQAGRQDQEQAPPMTLIIIIEIPTVDSRSIIMRRRQGGGRRRRGAGMHGITDEEGEFNDGTPAAQHLWDFFE